MLSNLVLKLISIKIGNIGMIELCHLARYRYPTRHGWWQAFKSQLSIMRRGDSRPWMNYAVIAFLEERVKPDWRVFEYGSGSSTHWWSQHVSSVIACEHDEVWYKRMQKEYAPNVTGLFVPFTEDGDYCRTILDPEGTFDVIVVDGKDRVRCVEHACSKVSENGVIILDDSEYPKFRKAQIILKQKGYGCLEIKGLKAASIYNSHTAIFYRSNNVFGL